MKIKRINLINLTKAGVVMASFVFPVAISSTTAKAMFLKNLTPTKQSPNKYVRNTNVVPQGFKPTASSKPKFVVNGNVVPQGFKPSKGDPSKKISTSLGDKFRLFVSSMGSSTTTQSPKPTTQPTKTPKPVADKTPAKQPTAKPPVSTTTKPTPKPIKDVKEPTPIKAKTVTIEPEKHRMAKREKVEKHISQVATVVTKKEDPSKQISTLKAKAPTDPKEKKPVQRSVFKLTLSKDKVKVDPKQDPKPTPKVEGKKIVETPKTQTSKSEDVKGTLQTSTDLKSKKPVAETPIPKPRSKEKKASDQGPKVQTLKTETVKDDQTKTVDLKPKKPVTEAPKTTPKVEEQKVTDQGPKVQTLKTETVKDDQTKTVDLKPKKPVTEAPVPTTPKTSETVDYNLLGAKPKTQKSTDTQEESIKPRKKFTSTFEVLTTKEHPNYNDNLDEKLDLLDGLSVHVLMREKIKNNNTGHVNEVDYPMFAGKIENGELKLSTFGQKVLGYNTDLGDFGKKLEQNPEGGFNVLLIPKNKLPQPQLTSDDLLDSNNLMPSPSKATQPTPLTPPKQTKPKKKVTFRSEVKTPTPQIIDESILGAVGGTSGPDAYLDPQMRETLIRHYVQDFFKKNNQ